MEFKVIFTDGLILGLHCTCTHNMLYIIDGEIIRFSESNVWSTTRTVLGPLMFLLTWYINDISENLTSHIRIFADDCIMYYIYRRSTLRMAARFYNFSIEIRFLPHKSTLLNLCAPQDLSVLLCSWRPGYMNGPGIGKSNLTFKNVFSCNLLLKSL